MIMVQGKNNTSQQGLSAFFQLPPIRNSSMYCPLQRTHSCCPPANLNTLKSSTHISWEHTKTYQLVEEKPGWCKFWEHRESLQAPESGAPPLEMKGWDRGRRGNKMTVCRRPTSSWWSKVVLLFAKTALMDTEDSYHKRWLVICSSGFL